MKKEASYASRSLLVFIFQNNDTQFMPDFIFFILIMFFQMPVDLFQCFPAVFLFKFHQTAVCSQSPVSLFTTNFLSVTFLVSIFDIIIMSLQFHAPANGELDDQLIFFIYM